MVAHRQPGLSGQIQRIMLEHDAARAEHFLLPGQAHVQVTPPIGGGNAEIEPCLVGKHLVQQMPHHEVQRAPRR